MAVKEGWTGRVCEDFEVGDVYRDPIGRTVTTADNIWFTLLTQNNNPIHFDHAYAAGTEFGKPLFNSTLTLAIVTGQSVIDLRLNVMANLGWDEVRLSHPVFEGYTLYSQSEVLSTRESKTRPHVGIVSVKTTGFNRDGTVVIDFRRTFMVYGRGHVPPASPAAATWDWVGLLGPPRRAIDETAFSFGEGAPRQRPWRPEGTLRPRGSFRPSVGIPAGLHEAAADLEPEWP